jgi:hypothetical protein
MTPSFIDTTVFITTKGSPRNSNTENESKQNDERAGNTKPQEKKRQTSKE